MPAENNFPFAPTLTSPLERGFAVTPNDSEELSYITREIHVGTGGTLALELQWGDAITLTNVADGARLPYRARKVLATGTTATDIVGLY